MLELTAMNTMEIKLKMKKMMKKKIVILEVKISKVTKRGSPMV
jgi:hypothetical protein